MKLNSGNNGQNDDAMFSKKYVGPHNCASCDKDILNLNGSPADYHAWKRLPFREPSERIARYGQGFSKILTMMRPSDSNPTLHQQSSAMERPDQHPQYQRDQFNMTHGPQGGIHEQYTPNKLRSHTLDDDFGHHDPHGFTMMSPQVKGNRHLEEDTTHAGTTQR